MEEIFPLNNSNSNKSNNSSNADFFGLTKLRREDDSNSSKQFHNLKSSNIIHNILIDDDDDPNEVLFTGRQFAAPVAQNINLDSLDFSNVNYRDHQPEKKDNVFVIEEDYGNSPKSQHTVLLGDDTMIIEQEGFNEIHGKFEEEVQEIQQTREKAAEDVEELQFFENNDNDKPPIYLNKLKYYPPHPGFQNTLSFRELMYEDLLAGDPDYPVRTLQSAFFTTYGYDLELLEPLLRAGVRVTLANDWDNSEDPRIEKNAAGFENFTIVRPYKDLTKPQRGVFHAKLWILKFPKFLRVVIGSGNLCIPQWVMWSNCLWFRDFPLKTSVKTFKDKRNRKDKNHRFDRDEDFVRTLEGFIAKMLPKWVNYIDLLGFSLDEYLFSDIDIVLIPSIPGQHYGKTFDKYGHRKVADVLKKTMRAKPSDPTKKRVLTYQATSLSSLDEKFLGELLSSFIPDYCTIEDLKARKESKEGAATTIDSINNRVRLIYPSKDYVENCKDGPQSARPLKLTPEGYAKKGFPKDIFHHFEAPEDGDIHSGLIPHLKVGIVTDESGEIDDDTVIYVGSHNFTPAAWGRYGRGYTELNIGNTELGVLYPPGRGTKGKKERIVDGMSFRFPPRKYEEGQVPWINKLHLKEK